MKIAIVGPYPPPYGGISIHNQRLEAFLKKEGHVVDVFPNRSVQRWFVDSLGKWFRYDLIHFHDMSWKSRVLIGLMDIIGFKVVLTIHGDSLKEQFANAGWIKRFLLRFSLRHITHIVGVKTGIRDLLLSLGVGPSRVSVINAYLPPILEHEDAISLSISNFIESHTPLIVANGFRVIPLSKQADLYGIEMTIDLCARLSSDYPQWGCLFFLAQIGDQNRYNEMVAKVFKLGLSKRFRFVLGESFAPTLKQATLFVRPTFKDGYGVSVAEALYFGIPALASDVCEREKGTIIFKCGDSDDFYRHAKRLLDDYETTMQSMKTISPISTGHQLLSLYQSVFNKK